jgi:hypothetical protein
MNRFKSSIIVATIGVAIFSSGCTTKETSTQEAVKVEKPAPIASEVVLKKNDIVKVMAVGQGVAPMNTVSPAQAYALAKRAAIADAYRIIAEKTKGVRVEGEDLISNMMVKNSRVRTYVNTCIKDANIVETTLKDGLCEVEMEITLSYTQFIR